MLNMQDSAAPPTGMVYLQTITYITHGDTENSLLEIQPREHTKEPQALLAVSTLIMYHVYIGVTLFGVTPLERCGAVVKRRTRDR